MERRETYSIHNTCRNPLKRDQRRLLSGPRRSQLNIFIGGGVIRVVRGAPFHAAVDVLKPHIKELIRLEADGLIEVYNSRSERVDLQDLQRRMHASGPIPIAVSQLPSIPLDNVADNLAVEEEQHTSVGVDESPLILDEEEEQEPPVEPVVDAHVEVTEEVTEEGGGEDSEEGAPDSVQPMVLDVVPEEKEEGGTDPSPTKRRRHRKNKRGHK